MPCDIASKLSWSRAGLFRTRIELFRSGDSGSHNVVRVTGNSSAIFVAIRFSSCARPTFPFSPVLRSDTLFPVAYRPSPPSAHSVRRRHDHLRTLLLVSLELQLCGVPLTTNHGPLPFTERIYPALWRQPSVSHKNWSHFDAKQHTERSMMNNGVPKKRTNLRIKAFPVSRLILLLLSLWRFWFPTLFHSS